MDLPLFDEVAEAVRALLPAELGALQQRPRRWGIKIWFGSEATAREHYEAQVIGARLVADATVLALEVGFHAEHPQAATNDAVIAKLVLAETRWRSTLGPEAVVGPFLGRPDDWRRVSETWADPDLSDPEIAMEVAARLIEYATALEPFRRDE